MTQPRHSPVGGSSEPGGLGATSRRVFLGAMGAGALAFVAFGPRGERESIRGRRVLDYWEKWTGHEAQAMRKVVDDFNASQDRLYVRYLVTGTIQEKAMVAIAGGNPPDIIGMYAYNVVPYAEANAVIPLDELAPRRGVSLGDYAPGMRPIMTHRGRWWGVVNTGGTMALYYNKALFREAGLDPLKPPRTLSEFDHAQERLTKRGPRGIERVGYLHMEPGWWSWFWGYHFGQPLYDAAADRALADAPLTVKAYEWMQSYPARLGVDETERFRSGFGPYGTADSAFLTGRVAMVNQGPWLANEIRVRRPDLEYGVCPVPVADGVYDPSAPIALIDTDVLMIPRGAKYPEASMEFLAYTQRPEVVEFLATAHCKGSPLLRVSDSFYASHPNPGVRLHTELAASPRAFTSPATPVWTEFKNVFDTGVDAIWKGEPAAKRLAAVQSAAQRFIDRYATLRSRRGEVGEGAEGHA